MAHIGNYTLKLVPGLRTSRSGLIPFYSIIKGQYSRGIWSPLLWIRRRVFGIHLLPSVRQYVSVSCSRECGRWCMRSKSNAECWKPLMNGQRPLNFLTKQSRCWATSNFMTGRIPAVSMLMDFIIPWLTTRTVRYPRHWSCLPARRFAMLSWSGKEHSGSSESFQVTTNSAQTWSIELFPLQEWRW
jgi:hypothetical protein